MYKNTISSAFETYKYYIELLYIRIIYIMLN